MATAAAEISQNNDEQEELEDLLSCAICLNLFNSPRKLPCHHVYCVDCLRQIVQEGNVLHCPECLLIHAVPDGGVDKFPVDFRIEKFVKMHQMTANELKDEPLTNLSSPFIQDESIKNQDDYALEGKLMKQFRQVLSGKLVEAKAAINERKAAVERQERGMPGMKELLQNSIKYMKEKLDMREKELLRTLNHQEQVNLKTKIKLNTADDEVSSLEKDILLRRSHVVDAVLSKKDFKKAADFLSEREGKLATICALHTSASLPLELSFAKQQDSLLALIRDFGEIIEPHKIDYSKHWKLLRTDDTGQGKRKWSETFGVAINPHNDHVYVTEDKSIIEYTSDGLLLNEYLDQKKPVDVAFNSEGKIIVSSWGDNTVTVHASDRPDLKDIQPALMINAQCQPTGVACTSNDFIYVVDKAAGQVKKFDKNGSILNKSLRAIKNGNFIVVSKDVQNTERWIYVADWESGDVMVFDMACKWIRSFGQSHLRGPSGIFIDSYGYILVADNKGAKIEVFDESEKHITTIRQPVEMLRYMEGIAVTRSGLLCITTRTVGQVHFLTQ